MNTWQGYNDDENRRAMRGPFDTWPAQRESPTYHPNDRHIDPTPVKPFENAAEADEFHADIAAWLKGGQA